MISRKSRCTLLVLLCITVNSVKSYKILGVNPLPLESHNDFIYELMKGLADDGNEVTFISTLKSSSPIKNLTEIHVDVHGDEDYTKFPFVPFNITSCFSLTNKLCEYSVHLTERIVQCDVFKDFLRQKHSFDVVIVQILAGDALLSLGYYFNAPVIAMSPYISSKWTRDLVGIPNLASFMPHMFTGYSDRMTFWQRAHNSLCYLYEDVINPLFYAAAQQTILDSMYPNIKKMPPIKVFQRNVSLVLYDSHLAVETPVPVQPNLIPVGGLGIKRKNRPKLPNDIQAFLNDSIGVIYVAFDSSANVPHFSQIQKDALINAFNEYPNMRIIFKSTENVAIPSHNASNVMVRPSFPHQSILAHKKVKVFITLGDKLSTTEAVHFAKPIIGIPVFYDQYLNMKMVEEKGFGISVPYEKLTTDKLRDAIRKIFTDSSCIQQLRLTSKRYWNQIKPPLDTAVYWVKHVAKNGGAPHLKSIAVDMPFFVYYNLDCWVLLVVSCILPLFIAIKLCKKLILHFLERSSSSKFKLP